MSKILAENLTKSDIMVMLNINCAPPRRKLLLSLVKAHNETTKYSLQLTSDIALFNGGYLVSIIASAPNTGIYWPLTNTFQPFRWSKFIDWCLAYNGYLIKKKPAKMNDKEIHMSLF